MNHLLPLAGFVLLSWAAAIPGIMFTPGDWYYQELKRPSWNPPSWLFGPVWSLLYTAMGVAAWLVWQEGGWSGASGLALGVFLGHLVLNALWSCLFFGIRRPDLAMLEVVALWLSIALTLVLFWQARPLAGALFVPYLTWVSFASVLNFSIWRLNREPDGASGIGGVSMADPP